ncbi:ALDH-like protein [Melanomma pulvis-pyrius CBS 109.77]|uniref:ALDH-like protein n=1 Tax=Melanomma pulvis-pyrius CBS 109.77 TaxID=1314802 RepID=A0A6A6XBU5_9PLEO|nr:ALDH-like protein [Melanomma pulvis-pyrius CBS 109.77]
MTEMGVDIGAAQFFVLPLAILMCRDSAGRISAICGSAPIVAAERQSALVLRESYGVCLGIVPWNAPYVFGIRSAATAIATGNTTVLESSELTPRCYWAIGKAFEEAGLPAGVLNIINCRPKDAPQIANVMIEHPAVRKINFAGSAATGRKIAKTCGENLKPCLMELRGKNAAIVCEDADLEKTARECILASAAPQDPPNVVSSASKQRLAALVSNAVSHGTSLISRPPTQPSTLGASFIPTILGHPSPQFQIYATDAFGSLVSVSSFTTKDEAMKIVTETECGLHAAVFTRI